MSKDPLYEQLLEISRRRKLTLTEQARLSDWLAAHPEAEADWASEAALTEALSALPNVPISSNFTAQVVASAQAQFGRTRKTTWRPRWLGLFSGGWLPKSALVGVVLTAGLLSYNHFLVIRRAEVARSLAAVSEVHSLTSPEILKDFDAIAALSSTPRADEELLKVMQ